MTMMIDPRQDEEFQRWFNKPSQKLSRALTNALGFNVSLTIASVDGVVAASIGWLHGFPAIQAGFYEHHSGKKINNVLAFTTACGSIQYIFKNKVNWLAKRPCKACEREEQIQADARMRVADELLSQAMDNGSTATKGALTRWG